MSTLGDLKVKIQNELRMNTNYRIWDETEIVGFLTRAVEKIEADGAYGWVFNEAEYSFTSIPTVANYSLPTGFVKLDGVVKLGSGSLVSIPYEALVRNYTDLTKAGRPFLYTLRGSAMRLYPVPTDTEAMFFTYRKSLTKMVSDSDSSGMEADFDEAIVQYACYLAFKSITGKEQKAISCVQNYEEQIKILNERFLGAQARDVGASNISFSVIQ